MITSPSAYIGLCVLLGAVLGWVPYFVHGPIPEKFNQLYIHGPTTVWGWYVARMLIGTWVGVTAWPRRWWLRGPLCGFFVLLPLGIVSLGVPTCGLPCLSVNVASAALVGLAVAGLARLLTGRDHAGKMPYR